MNKTIKRARETLIHKGLCAIDGSGDPDIEALFAYLANNEKGKFVVGVAKKGQFEVMENMALSFGTLEQAKEWRDRAKKSVYYEGAYFTIFKKIEVDTKPLKVDEKTNRVPEFDDISPVCMHCKKRIPMKISHGLWGHVASQKAIGRTNENFSSIHKINCPHCGKKIRICVYNGHFRKDSKHPILVLNGEEI